MQASHYGLKWALAGLMVVGFVACERPGSAEAPEARTVAWRGRVLSAPLPRPEFTLTDTAGEPYDFAARTSGSLTLLFFGYTSCPDVCPNHLSQLAAARRQLSLEDPFLAEAVRVVFVGVDAPRDTPAQVERWLAHFDPSFVGLVGDEASLRAAQEAALVPVAERDAEGADGGYSVSHAAVVIAYTPDDQAHLRYGISTQAEDWVHDLRILAEEGWPAS